LPGMDKEFGRLGINGNPGDDQMNSVTLLLHPRLGLALSQYETWLIIIMIHILWHLITT